MWAHRDTAAVIRIMARPGESFTLLESGTTRQHFKLAKALEDSSTPEQQDSIILDTIAQLRSQLTSRAISSGVSKLTSTLLTLLHCLQHYPASNATLTLSHAPLDVSFALIPTLQLLGLATDWKHLLLAYQLLPYLLPFRRSIGTGHGEVAGLFQESGSHDLDTRSQTSASASTLSRPPSSIAPAPASNHHYASASLREGQESRPSDPKQGIDDSSSLLLLNTFRINLTAATEHIDQHDDRSDRQRPARSASQSRSPSSPRSPSRTRPEHTIKQDPHSVRTQFRALETLRSLATGTPKGPAVLPSLASTLVALTRHPDSSIRSLTLSAMLACASAPMQDEGDKDGQVEMLDAALTIVRLILASPYAFTVGSGLDEQQGVILSEMERRVDSNPSVLRSCIRVVEHARERGLISSSEAACHAVEALQASKWVPMHLDLQGLQQQRTSSSVVTRTEGIRARMAAKQRAQLQADHDYHGTYSPWLVEACLSSLTQSIGTMLQTSATVDAGTSTELIKTVLRIYNVASQGKAAALPLCVSAARCIGTLYSQVAPSPSRSDGECVALWSSASTHIMTQLHSTNSNRKTAGLVLLEAMLPVGWAQVTEPEQGANQGVARYPLHVSEADMGQLMALLADSDTFIRKRALALLHRVDPNITLLLHTQLQSAVDSASSNAGANSASQQGKVTAKLSLDVLQRLVEVAVFAAVSSEVVGGPSESKEAQQSSDNLERAIDSSSAYGLFGSFEDSSSPQEDAWQQSFRTSIRALSFEARLDLLQRMTRKVGRKDDVEHTASVLYLICHLLCDFGVRDLNGETNAQAFISWIVSDLLGSEGLSGVLARLSVDQGDAVAAREAVMGVLARTISLVIQTAGFARTASDLAASLQTLRSTLSKVIEAGSPAALRTEASNLQLICQSLLHLDTETDAGLRRRVLALASQGCTIEASVKALLELHIETDTNNNRVVSRSTDSSCK